ncbi:MAG: hypothetical protein ABEJ94_01880 [Halorientalis sp.]
MPRDTSNRLVEFARGQIGDALRTVIVLYEADHEVIYLREDLEDGYTPTRFERVTDSFRTDLGIDDAPGDSPVGRKRAIIHEHENAFVFQFPHPDCHSILMSVEPGVGTRLRSFVSECQRRI